MGWYFRKSVNLGPLRLNFSKSGIGYSVGVKGARIGSGPRGSYVRLGRGGVYYQQTISPSRPEPAPAITPDGELKDVVRTANASDLRDSTAETLLIEIEERHRLWRLAPLSYIAGILLVCLAIYFRLADSLLVASIVFAVTAAIFARKFDFERKFFPLEYNLDKDSTEAYVKLLNALEFAGSASKLWRITSSEANADPKYHAGAQTSLKRFETRLTLGAPDFMACNKAVFNLLVGSQKLYFFPDRILIFQGATVGAVAYDSLSSEVLQVRFVEEGTVPQDSQILDYTWAYTNKNGGPDRRFSNNYQIPVVGYASLFLQSSGGLNIVLQFSDPTKALALSKALTDYKDAVQDLTASELPAIAGT